tara:strand:+ start:381 stop:833 length:453 start_codon:yes stop_codon:yes gene_type:complete
MKQGRTEKVVFAKLSKVEKVELSSISEISKLANSVEQEAKEFLRLATKAESLAVEFDKAARRYHTSYMELNDLEDKMDKFVKKSNTENMFLELDYAIDQVETKVKELGIDTPKELAAAKSVLKSQYSAFEENADAYFRLKELQSKYKFPF